MSGHTLLVCTVGGSEEAVAAAIMGCAPDRILFVVSPQTSASVDGRILPLLSQERHALGVGQYEAVLVPDAQDLSGCVEAMRQVGSPVADWVARGPDFQVIVDITGGTKCMAAALALVARAWPCRFSYVGGQERTKDGVGVVVSGKECILHSQNPWDALGYQAMEEAVVLFDMGDYQATMQVLKEGLGRVERADLKAELETMLLLAEAYLLWDLFEHQWSLLKLEAVEAHANDLRHALPGTSGAVISEIRVHQAFLSQFKDGKPGRHHILDLLANARRCGNRARYDDAVARLYRAVEGVAQVRLRDHGIEDTGKVRITLLPQRLQGLWGARAQAGMLILMLNMDYKVLKEKNDDLAGRFYRLGLDGDRGALTARNQSILAHGWTPVGQGAFDDLWKKTLDLAGIGQNELPCFPKLGAVRPCY